MSIQDTTPHHYFDSKVPNPVTDLSDHSLPKVTEAKDVKRLINESADREIDRLRYAL